MATEEDASIAQQCSDEVTESLEMLDAVLLQFDEEKQTPPPPEEAARIISSLVTSPYQSLQRGQGTQTTLPRPSKKLSSQFGSLPFDLSAHAAPSAPPWLNKEAPRNHLHLPIQNPLTATVGQSSEDEQFSDDSLEGQIWSSDRDLSSGRDDAASHTDAAPRDEAQVVKSQSRSSIAWDIDWNEKKGEDKEKGGKGTYVIRDRKRRAALDDALFDRRAISTSKSSDHLAKSVKISRGRSLPSLTSGKPLENGIIVPIIVDSDMPLVAKYVDILVDKDETLAPSEPNAVDDEPEKCDEEKVPELELVNGSTPTEEAAVDDEPVACNGFTEPEPVENSSLDDSAIIPVVPSVAEAINEEIVSSVVECAMISTKNQNNQLENKVLVNGIDKDDLSESLEIIEDELPNEKEKIVQEEQIQVKANVEAPAVVEAINDCDEMLVLQNEMQSTAQPVETELEAEPALPVIESKEEVIEEKDVEILPEAVIENKMEESIESCHETEVEPEKTVIEDNTEEIVAPPLSEILDSGSDESEEEKNEHPGPCEMSFKIMRPKVVRPNSLPAREENVVVYTTSVTLYPDAGLITYYDESKVSKEAAKVEPPSLMRPKSCSDITAGSFACVDINIDDEPLSLEPVTATEEASEAVDDDDETEELDEEIKEEMKERVMELPIKVECMVQTEISGLGKKLCLESPGEQVVPSLAGFTPVENKSMELSLLAAKAQEEDDEDEEVEELLPAIQKPVFSEPLLRERRRHYHGSHIEVNAQEQRRSAPESFLFPGSYTIPLSFAVTNKPPPSPGSDADEFVISKEKKEEKPEFPWEARSREIRVLEEKAREKVKTREEKPVPAVPPHSIESRPKAKTPVEPEYRSVHKNRPPPPLPPHQHLTELYSEPRNFPDAFPAPPPPPLGASFPEHKPLPPTPLTPDRPLPPSPPRLPTSASFPVPPVARHSPIVPHRPLPSPPNTLKTRSVDAGFGKGVRDHLKSQQGCTLPPDLGGATPRRGPAPGGRKKQRAPAVPPHASLPETPVFSRGCDIPRAPYRALGIPVLRSSLSEEGAALCGPGRGWYPKQRRPAARSTEHLEQAGWTDTGGGGGGGGGGGRKPHTLPPNMSPPKFFHRSSPREALRRVTSLLIRGRGAPPAPPPPPAKPKQQPPPPAPGASSGETPQRQKRSFFRHFWKKSKHYSLEQ